MHISIWEKESFFKRQDIIIVGGGLAGLWCAYELLHQHPSLQLLILDKEIIPAGASTRNAGFACFGSPTELLHDAATMGEERMLHVAEMRYKGIQKIRTVLGDDAIGYDDCGGYECLRNDIHSIDEVIEKTNWLNSKLESITGNENTFAVCNEKLTRLGFRGFDALIENKYEGALHSGKLVMALRGKVLSLGAQIMQGTEVKKWEENASGVVVHTKQNFSISASRLLICTNVLSQHLLPQISVSPARGQIIVTTPIDNLPIHGTFHFDEGFYYFRNIGNRVLLGGARNSFFNEEATTSFETSDNIQNTLERFLGTHILPNKQYEIEYRWSGIMGFTEDKQPMIKQLSACVTAVVICNGMGVALSPIIAEQIEL